MKSLFIFLNALFMSCTGPPGQPGVDGKDGKDGRDGAPGNFRLL